jgi:hypothetical protein
VPSASANHDNHANHGHTLASGSGSLELEEAGKRAADITAMINEKQAALDQRIADRKGKGSGRLKASEQAIDAKLSADIVKLHSGYFPKEVVPTARAPIEQVFNSAR